MSAHFRLANPRFIRKAFNQLETKLGRYHSHANVKSVKKIQDNNNSGNYCSSDNQFRDLLHIAVKHNSTGAYRNRTSSNCFYDGCNIISGGIQFFMDAKQRHYEVLNKNIFKPLSEMQLKQNENEESIFKTFENTLPVNGYKYEDALLHLKKRDAKNVDNDIEKYL